MMKSAWLLAVSSILFLACLSPAFPAEISGGAYYWDSLEPARPIVFSINTTPAQTIVSQEGGYSFTVGPGTYAISAKKMENGQASFEDSSEITVLEASVEEYRIDFILFPSDDYLSEEMNFSEENEGLVELPKEGAPQNAFLAIIPALLAGAFIFAFLANRKKAKGAPKGVPKGAPKGVPKGAPKGVPKGAPKGEAGEIVGIIKEAGGRITQRDLRKSLPYSEAKASLIVSELEATGVVKKYKRGRANLLVLSQDYR